MIKVGYLFTITMMIITSRTYTPNLFEFADRAERYETHVACSVDYEKIEELVIRKGDAVVRPVTEKCSKKTQLISRV